MTQKINLYKKELRDKNGKLIAFRDVNISIAEDGLVVGCCDINNAAKSLWGDSGVEFYLNLDRCNLKMLKSILEIKDNISLLERMYARFKDKDSCFEDIMDFLKANDIGYNYSRW